MDNNNFNQNPDMSQWAPNGQDSGMNQQNMGQDPYMQQGMEQEPYVFQSSAVNGAQSIYEQPKKSKAGLYVIVTSLVIIALAAGAYFLLFAKGGDYTKPLDNIAKVVNSHDTSLDNIMDSVLPSFAAKPMKSAYSIMGKSSTYGVQLAEAKSKMAQVYAGLGDITISYKVKSKDSLTSSECSAIENQYRSLYTNYLAMGVAGLQLMTDEQLNQAAAQLGLTGADLKPLVDDLVELGNALKDAKVSSGYKLNVTLTASSSTQGDDSIDVSLQVININGEWMIDFISLLSDNGINLNNYTNLF